MEPIEFDRLTSRKMKRAKSFSWYFYILQSMLVWSKIVFYQIVLLAVESVQEGGEFLVQFNVRKYHLESSWNTLTTRFEVIMKGFYFLAPRKGYIDRRDFTNIFVVLKELRFTSNETVSSQNFRYWSYKFPHFLIKCRRIAEEK